MKNLKKLFLPLLIAVFLSAIICATIFVGCKPEPKTIKIGAILPLTGNLAFLGEPENNAIVMAVDKINREGGINNKKLEVVVQDSKGDPKEGVTIVNRFLEVDKMSVIITSLTTISLATQPLFEKNNAVQIALCMHPTIADKSEYTFRIFDNIWLESELILAYVGSMNPLPKNVVILYAKVPEQESSAKEYLSPGLEKLGINVPLVESYEMTQKDFTSTVTKIKTYNPDVLIIMGFGHTYPSLFKALNAFGMLKKSKIVGGLGFLELPQGTDMKLFEGVVFVAPSYEVGGESPKGKLFIEGYKTKYGRTPPFDAGYMYDAVCIIAEAIKKAGTAPEKIREALLEIKSYDGVTGKIEILPNGDSKVSLALAIYRNGKIELLERAKQ